MPRIWNNCNGLFTNINMAYKIIKWDHWIWEECMISNAFLPEENKNAWSLSWPSCPKDKSSKIKIRHSLLEEALDPK